MPMKKKGGGNSKRGSKGNDQSSGPNKKVGFNTPSGSSNSFSFSSAGGGGIGGGASSFGFNAQAPAPAPSGGFNFSSPAPAPAPSGGFSFSSPAPAPAPAGGGFSFNTAGSSTNQASGGGGGFSFSSNTGSSTFSSNTGSSSGSGGFSFSSNTGNSSGGGGFSFSSNPQGGQPNASGSFFNNGAVNGNNGPTQPNQVMVNSDMKYHELTEEQQKKLREVWTFIKEQESSLQTIRDYVAKERGKRPKNLEELDKDAEAFEQDVQRVAVLQQAQQRKIDDATRITWGESENNKVPCLQSVEEHVKKSVGTSRSCKNYPHLPHQFWWQLFESLEQKKDDVQVKLSKLDLVLSCGEDGTSQLNNIRQKLKVQTSSTIHLADFSFQNSQKIEKLKAHFAYKLSDLNLEGLD